MKNKNKKLVKPYIVCPACNNSIMSLKPRTGDYEAKFITMWYKSQGWVVVTVEPKEHMVDWCICWYGKEHFKEVDHDYESFIEGLLDEFF